VGNERENQKQKPGNTRVSGRKAEDLGGRSEESLREGEA
jgi:hypothetical protein